MKSGRCAERIVCGVGLVVCCAAAVERVQCTSFGNPFFIHFVIFDFVFGQEVWLSGKEEARVGDVLNWVGKRAPLA